MSALLDIRNLTLDLYADGSWRRVLDDVSFQVGRGEVVALVGESGSGKTMTALSVLGLTPSRKIRRQGEIIFDGRNLLSLDEEELRSIRGRQIGMVFQEPAAALHPSLTIGAQVAEVLRAHTDTTRQRAAARAVEMLGEVRIPDPQSRAAMYPFQLSGGMQQRAMLASALICDPLLLVADEPTTALDVTVQAQILELLSEEQRLRELAILFVTHDLSLVQRFSQRTVVMYQGQVVEDRSTPDVVAHPRHPYTRSLLDAAQSVTSAPVTLNALDPMTATGCRYAARCPERQEICIEQAPPIQSTGSGSYRCVLAAEPPSHRTASLTDAGGVNEGGVLLRCEQLRKAFAPRRRALRLSRLPTIVAVDGVDVSVPAGQTVAIVGESGSGKSTTARMILRLLDPTSGRIEFEGRDVTRIRGRELRALRAQIQAVFQDPAGSLDPTMSVGTHLTTSLRLHRGLHGAPARARVAELLELVQLPSSFARRYPNELSGGQRQRVALARALAAQPKLIVLDEPVSALDVSTQANTMAMLMELQRKLGLAYLLIAHDLPLVRNVSHHVAVMYRGAVLEHGSTNQVFTQPRHPYTQALLSLAHFADIDREPIILSGDPSQAPESPGGCRFRDRCPYAMDVCAIEPPSSNFPDGGGVACHLHTAGPMLSGQSVDLLLPKPPKSSTDKGAACDD
ncbi:MAG: ABC transporter ATP-binding protein [Acidimicrobiales bacterium]